MDKMFPIIGVLAVLFGLTFLGITVALALRKYLRLKKSIAATGVVVHVEISKGMRQNHSARRSTLYKPTVRFQTADGRVINYTPMMANSWSNYGVGENVPVHYDPQQPENPIIGNASGRWFPFIICVFVGGMFTVVGGVFILFGLV
ncbi:hypothetical protein BH20ACI4_BH20ACI4_15680 [soil metagenome]